MIAVPDSPHSLSLHRRRSRSLARLAFERRIEQQTCESRLAGEASVPGAALQRAVLVGAGQAWARWVTRWLACRSRQNG